MSCWNRTNTEAQCEAAVEQRKAAQYVKFVESYRDTSDDGWLHQHQAQ
jgi:hypothetical protein